MNDIDFKVIYLPTNQGHGNARRVSLENCSNELVALMDADDISLPNRFEKQLELFEKDRELDVVGGQITEFVGSPDNIIGKRIVPIYDHEIKLYMKKRCPMNQVTVMFKKSFYNQVGGYIDWFCEEDYYLWIRMALANGKFANTSDTLVNVRVGNEMSARRGGWKYFSSEVKIQLLMLKKHLIGLPLFIYNVGLRFGGEIVLPNKLRTKLFVLLREKKTIDSICLNCNYQTMKAHTPFSVAMCVYGGDNANSFEIAVDSIINQSCKPNEIVLVVDGEVPESIENVINKYSSIYK